MVIANYPDQRQEFFKTYFSPRNKEYCDIHGYEYLEYLDTYKPFRDHPTWWKFTIVRDLLNDGTLKEGDTLIHIDADMCIHRLDLEYPSNKSFTYCIDSGNTHCMGNYSIIVDDWSRQLILNIISEDRYNFYKNKIYHHPMVNNYNFWGWFREQASWYSLAGIKAHSDESFWNLPDYGWHSLKDEWTIYSLEELYEHVEILPTPWNVTEMPGESGCVFNINPVDRKDVIIRHFAGGQPWRNDY